MKRSDHTQGMTMVIIILFTLLLLMGILAASMRLGLTSRQNAADQTGILKAQYAAESSYGLLQSEMRDIQRALRTRDDSGLIKYIFVPTGTTETILKGWMESFCGSTNWQTVSASMEFENVGSNGQISTVTPSFTAPSAQSCNFTATGNASQYTLLSKVLTVNAYNEFPVAERPAATDAAEQSFWNARIGQARSVAGPTLNGVPTAYKYTIIPTRIVKFNSKRYRVYMKVSSAAVKGGDGASSRVLSVSSQKNTDWWFEINMPSLLDNVLHTDIHKNKAGSTIYFQGDQTFDGPIHTNDKFMFNTGARTIFNGSVTSTGCTNYTVAGCAPNPGVGIAGSYQYGGNAFLKQAVLNIANNGIQFNGGDPNFAADYKPLPTNANNQKNAADGLDNDGQPLSAAEGKGLNLGSFGTVVGVQMFAGDASQNPLSSYDSTNRKWAEPNPTYQYIKIATTINKDCTTTYVTGRCKDVPAYSTTLRVDSNGAVTKLVGGTWQTYMSKFNGMIYSPNGIQSLQGPGRDSGGRARPALASFSKVTVAAEGKIQMKSDLALSQAPCTNSEYSNVSINPPCNSRQNVLGIYSQSGDVTIDLETPSNPILHAMIMSSSGEVAVEAHNQRAESGSVYLTGGIVEKYYGAFGTNTPTGFSRVFTYDRRFNDPDANVAPPYFPVSPTWSSVDGSKIPTLGLNKLMWKQATVSDF